jgi:predicted AAA+ superfamily ATPase
VGQEFQQRLWLRGGFPRSYLAADDAASDRWRQNFIATFLERDLAQLGFGVQPPLMMRLWSMLAHMHGQIWNASPLSSSLGVSAHTVRNYLDVLSQTYMIRQLQPWHSNISKRQVKAPKIYFRDSGLLHRLLGIRTQKDLMTHPQMGASWEGWVIEEIIRRWKPEEVYFWAVHSGAELDLLMIKDGKKIGVECKRADAPQMTRSMHSAMEDISLDELLIAYPGARSLSLAPGVRLLPLGELAMRGDH